MCSRGMSAHGVTSIFSPSATAGSFARPRRVAYGVSSARPRRRFSSGSRQASPGAGSSGKTVVKQKAEANIVAETPKKKDDKKVAELPKPFVPPTLDTTIPSPVFGGSTGGLARSAQTEEFYVITWEAKKKAEFEMPIGGIAIMREGKNLLKFARKEQCLALTKVLRTEFKYTPCFYRVYPDGEVEYLHPKDGVYPEKVNPGRKMANCITSRRIGENPSLGQIKWSGKEPWEWEGELPPSRCEV